MEKDEIIEIEEMQSLAIEKINVGEYKNALKIAREIKKNFEPHYHVSQVVGSILISVGRNLNKENLTREGIDLIKPDLENIVKNQKDPSGVYYNIANGYYDLFLFKWDKKPYYNRFKHTGLDEAKINFRLSLEYNSKKPDTFVNLGNCYDHLGRTIDALECYEKALDLKPDYAMALGNKGIALCKYSFLLGKKYKTLLIDAHYFISKALEIGVSSKSKNSFTIWLKCIEKHFDDKKLSKKSPNFPGYKIEAKSDLSQHLKEQTMENQLYLNVCSFCQKCDASIGDTINIERMRIKIDEDYSIDNDPYLRLSSHLNHIKEDYISARFLLILSGYNDLDLNFVYEDARFIETLDYSLHNMDLQLLRLSFRNFYDILDKIAFFINDHLNLEIEDTRINFMKIWYSTWNYSPKKREINEKIIETQSDGLNALFDIHWDFEENGSYYNLRKTRNALTHRYVNIKMFCIEESDVEMTPETFLKRTLELAGIVRNAIFYLMYFVNEMERNKLKQ
ncbi:LA2681 family HEPN domain-containing protein [Methanobacterium sp. SMA-27]|uniref:LA2681 family HEPN domain-containing protein n=1 Tax=Methanobacterium sp. SMA-27 TaxID=1495336 RepID=UPI00064F6354|nr:LA2681 family HEPN domain-containing protein [Methanobacterium sp. SMA-27]